jgi:hypothetical protein
MTADPLGGNVGNLRFQESGGLHRSPDTGPQSLNRYGYVTNNPASLTDPLGLKNIMDYRGGGGGGGLLEDSLEIQASETQFGSNFNEFYLLAVATDNVNMPGCPYGDCPQGDAIAAGAWAVLNYIGFPSYFAGVGSALAVTGGGPRTPQTPTKTCNASARVLQGNPATVGLQGGIPGVKVQAGSAAVVPSEFGVSNGAGLAPYALQISGYFPGTGVSFQGVTDVIGAAPSQVPLGFSNIRQYLEFENPGQIIIELPTGNDLGPNVPAIITVRAGAPCPTPAPVIGDFPTGPTVG